MEPCSPYIAGVIASVSNLGPVRRPKYREQVVDYRG